MAISVFLVVTFLTLQAFSPVNFAFAQAAPQGPWVDSVVFAIEDDEALALEKLKNNEIQAYYFPLRDPTLFQEVKESPDLWYMSSYGSYNELTFNPVGPEFPATGELNPFSVPRIREAMNYLVDRDYLAEEICGGLAVPRYFAITPSFPDYARYIDVARMLELEYHTDFEKAKTIITEEMQKLGATLTNGKWYYKGNPVVIKFIIRTEDERRDMGDWVSTKLEELGFTVDRQYKTSSEASPIWIGSDPAQGLWHMYTGGWVTTAISRDQGGNFDFFYTPRGLSVPLWQAYKPDPEFDYVSDRLARRDFESMEERDELMAKALELSMKDSVRVWLVNRVSPWVARKEITLTGDLAGGFYGSWMWPRTIRFKDTTGGTVQIASGDILVDPWNPVDGSNWIYDQMIIRATYDPSLLPDPFTGLYWPNRIEKAEVYVQSGLPVTKTLDWVTLGFSDEIVVPDDAWYGWNATAKEIITVGDLGESVTAKTKTVIYFDENLFNIKYHDGTNMSLADFIFNFIFTFDRADPASPIYDESYVPAFESFRESFKGFKIVQEDPLIVEYYSDVIYLDAEWIAVDAADAFDPNMAFGPAPWHMIAIGWLAESQNQLAFSSDKADALQVEWMSYVAGPSLDILSNALDQAIASTFIPYVEVLGNYTTGTEALDRYNALKDWYTEKGHFWVGNGPFYLEGVYPTEQQVVINAFREHPDSADRWAIFTEPKLPELSVSGPDTVTQSLPADFNLSVTFKGAAYPTEELDFIKYLIVGPTGTVLTVGAATPVEDGTWKIKLSSADTSLIPTGTSTIQIVAASKLVSIPTSDAMSFITISFGEFLNIELGRLRAELNATISGLEDTTTQLKDQIASLESTVSSLNTIATASIVIAAIAIVISLVITVLFRRK